MKSREIRDNWRDVIDYVRAGNEVVVEHYNKAVARIVPMETSMNTTTSYGTFIDRCADSGSSGNISAYVTSALGDHTADYDVDALTEKLDFLVTHPEVWGPMGQAGRRHVMAEFNAPEQGKRLEGIYRELIQRRK